MQYIIRARQVARTSKESIGKNQLHNINIGTSQRVINETRTLSKAHTLGNSTVADDSEVSGTEVLGIAGCAWNCSFTEETIVPRLRDFKLNLPRQVTPFWR